MGYTLDCLPKELETELKDGDLKGMEAEEEEEERRRRRRSVLMPLV